MQGENVRGLYFYTLGSVKCEGFVYIYMETVVRAVGLVQGENVRGLYFYTLGSVKCEGFV